MIKILFLASNPVDTTKLRLDQEVHSIDTAIRQSKFRDQFEIHSHWALRIEDLQELLLRHQPDIIHFCGHGSTSSEIILQDENGYAVTVSHYALSELFHLLKDNIRCVVLNACFSADQAAGIATHIACVIGITDAIEDDASIGFAAAFYRALGFGHSVKTAFELGCNQLSLTNLGENNELQLLSNADPSLIKFVNEALYSIDQDHLPSTGIAPSDNINVSNLSNSYVAAGRDAKIIVSRPLSLVEEARQQENFEEEILASGLSRLVENLRHQINSAQPNIKNVYKYLHYFEVADADLFFGRDRIVSQRLNDLISGTTHSRLTVIHGAPGIGKSSFLRAGLATKLIAAEHLPVVIPITGDPSTSDSVTDKIKRRFVQDLNRTPGFNKERLCRFMQRIVDSLPPHIHVFIMLDQFERFFDLPDKLKDPFIIELADTLNDDNPRLHWLISLRSSKFGDLLDYWSVIPQNVHRLKPLSRQEARLAICKPAEICNVYFDDELVDAILDDLGSTNIDPSRLQIVCHVIIQGLNHGKGKPTLADYQSVGCADGILADYLDRILTQNFRITDRSIAWRALVAISEKPNHIENENDLIEHLATHNVSESDAQRVLERLVNERLLHVSDDSISLSSRAFLPNIQQWAMSRAVSEQVRIEVNRQVAQMRNSAIRGMLGGACGFSLSYLLIFWSRTEDDIRLLIFSTILGAIPGAIAGLLLTLAIDIVQKSYHGPKRRVGRVVAGLAGAGSFAVALGIHAALTISSPFESTLFMLEGAVWGFVAGLLMAVTTSQNSKMWPNILGTGLWHFFCRPTYCAHESPGNDMRTHKLAELAQNRQYRRILGQKLTKMLIFARVQLGISIVAVICGLVLYGIDTFGGAFQDTPWGIKVLIGGIVPLSILVMTLSTTQRKEGAK